MFPFLQYTVSLVKTVSSFAEGLEESLYIRVSWCFRVLGPSFFFSKWLLCLRTDLGLEAGQGILAFHWGDSPQSLACPLLVSFGCMSSSALLGAHMSCLQEQCSLL